MDCVGFAFKFGMQNKSLHRSVSTRFEGELEEEGHRRWSRGRLECKGDENGEM